VGVSCAPPAAPPWLGSSRDKSPSLALSPRDAVVAWIITYLLPACSWARRSISGASLAAGCDADNDEDDFDASGANGEGETDVDVDAMAAGGCVGGSDGANKCRCDAVVTDGDLNFFLCISNRN